ncbi:RAD55 family ATPase [Archaeoglobus veneficus]|uniref:ATPase n=1 Tax=Archaeoglobus veneficus (strain DSM 11195 / SNP6) TaxID=693661 RepID=F2KSF3_ARCVS|nr:ATPase domain-containing protein [Archaeoglobus veneficus]AEA46922.1 ATPase [Archaeoglobus veneficus SNP6]
MFDKAIDASPTGKTTIFKDTFFSDFVPDVGGFKSVISAKLEKEPPSRVVIDPITMLELASRSELEYRRDVLSLLQILRESKVTTIITSEITDRGVEDYLVSGVIELLSYDVGGKTLRGVKITKMRSSAFDENVRPYRITSKGIEVYSDAAFLER